MHKSPRFFLIVGVVLIFLFVPGVALQIGGLFVSEVTAQPRGEADDKEKKKCEKCLKECLDPGAPCASHAPPNPAVDKATDGSACTGGRACNLVNGQFQTGCLMGGGGHCANLPMGGGNCTCACVQ